MWTFEIESGFRPLPTGPVMKKGPSKETLIQKEKRCNGEALVLACLRLKIRQMRGRMTLLDSGTMLFATLCEWADSLQTTFKPGVKLAACDIYVQYLVCPVEILEGSHQGMFGAIG